jgi:CheY-like chemotaxis protein
MPDGGEIRVATRLLGAGAPGPSGSAPESGPRMVLSVTDTGTGMTAETRARLFEPFFTTKPEGKGTGLGLSMVYGIVHQMGGAIDVNTALGRGTTFTITLPAEPTSLPTPASESAAPARARGETVLLVDDQESIRRTVGMLLSDMGYRVVEASNGESAIRAVGSSSTGRVDVLLTDVGMPHMNGVELATRLRSANPDIAVVFMSGYADRPIDGVGGAPVASVSKPFTHTELSAAIRRVLEGRKK